MVVAHDTGTFLSNYCRVQDYRWWSVVVCLWCSTSVLLEGINDLHWLLHNSWKWLYPHLVTTHIWNDKRVQKIHSEYTPIAKNYQRICKWTRWKKSIVLKSCFSGSTMILRHIAIWNSVILSWQLMLSSKPVDLNKNLLSTEAFEEHVLFQTGRLTTFALLAHCLPSWGEDAMASW